MKLKVELNKLKKYFYATLGVALTALSFGLFINPLKIVVGGTTGLAIIIEAIFKIDTSLFITIFYIAMLLVNTLFYGINETKKLLFCSILYPLCVSLFTKLPLLIEFDYTDKLLCYLTAAIIYGIGTGLIFKNGFVGGGVDVIKKIISDKIKMPLGKATFIIDSILIISGGFIFGINSVLYAIIILYISSKVIDRIMLGISGKKMFYIMTKHPNDVRKCIKDELKCGITEIDAIGAYTTDKHHVLMTVISTHDYVKLKNRITEIDNKAFFIITDSYHVYHHGK